MSSQRTSGQLNLQTIYQPSAHLTALDPPPEIRTIRPGARRHGSLPSHIYHTQACAQDGGGSTEEETIDAPIEWSKSLTRASAYRQVNTLPRHHRRENTENLLPHSVSYSTPFEYTKTLTHFSAPILHPLFVLTAHPITHLPTLIAAVWP